MNAELRCSGRTLRKTNLSSNHKFLSVISISLLFWTFYSMFFCSYILYRDNSQYFAQNNTLHFLFHYSFEQNEWFFWEQTAAWIEFVAVLYLFNFEIVLLVMVTRVGPLELVIIGLEKASLVTHNGSFPPILFFVQSFSSLLCIIFSPHLNDTKRSKRLLKNGVFSFQIHFFPIFQAISSWGKTDH